MADDRLLVVGLGNPGPRYAATRHNAGFFVVDLLAERIGGRFKAHKGRADIVEGRLAGKPVVLAKPKSYMNESGGPIVSISRFFKVPIEQITIVHDDLDLAFGALRLKRGGGDGGHNGLRSATSALGSKDYAGCGSASADRPVGRIRPTMSCASSAPLSARKSRSWLTGPPTQSRPCSRRASKPLRTSSTSRRPSGRGFAINRPIRSDPLLIM